MRLQKIKLFTGATLSVLISAVSVNPAMANLPIEIAQTQTTTTANAQTVTGFVKSIVGDVVTIREDNAPYRTLRIQKCVLKILGLVPGMKVRASYVGSQVDNIVVIPNYKVVSTTVVRPSTPPPRPAPAPEPPPRPAPAPRPIPRPAPAPIPAPRPVPAPRPAPVRGLW
ncbi:autotransporter [Microcoleus sp. bin38.metabat.b11b12b14.051]|uniref:autotransporter n=1 Tax=Microcoleus sp. bin38.metabat.b11b12b14.051 TaxID=2742709 RepID=UPI0025DEF2D9|nr:autotransporter [Microcoleus sp. bin38.metabat.b11b12b14.051]